MSYQNAKAGLIGDLHITDRAVGKYEDYFANCREVCENISKLIKSEHLTHLFLAGDIVGVHDKTMKSNAARLWLFQIFAQWNTLLNGNLYSLRGNHDSGATTCDYELLEGAMLFKHVSEVDCGGFRVHLIDYGDDTRELNLSPDSDVINVAFMHTHLTVENKTNFIPFKGGTELSDMRNLKPCEIVACGHIHNPSLTYLQTSIEGSPTNLIYLGCPTRPSAADNWDKTSVLILETVVENGIANTMQRTAVFNLRPKSELLKETIADATIEGLEEDAEQGVNIEDLERILGELSQFQIGGSGSYKDQITRLAGLNKAAADLAIHYIERAEGNENGGKK